MTISFKEYLIEYNEEPQKNDVSMNNDEELVDWVLNDEGLYNIAQTAQTFDELMDYIDASFIYNNDQYNALARAFRMGDLRDEQQEEEEVKAPATQDMLKVAMNRPKETSKEMQPSSKRWSQRHKRQRRQIGL